MEVLTDLDALRRWRAGVSADLKVGLVPTMGALHAGHLSLVDEARRRVDAGPVVMSIFVNPTQFGPGEDLEAYPRTLDADVRSAHDRGVDLVFAPEAGAMYPSRDTWVNVERLSDGLCGASRPTHFRGVCTVVTKLWNLVRPDVAVFGRKDAQQLAILRRLHGDLFLSGEIVDVPIVRESDGLAMSSRNTRLDPAGRRDAVKLSSFLARVRERFDAGERGGRALLAGAEAALAPGRIDYVSLVDAVDLQPIERVDAPAMVALAVHVSGVRLIDNDVLVP